MARTKLGATSSLEAARMLSEAEGYGQRVAQTPDLPPHALLIQTVFTRPLIFGAIAMTLIAAVLLAFVMQATGEHSTPTETGLLARDYDEQLNLTLMAMIGSAAIGPDGEIVLTHPLPDQRFLELNSGRYWQISAVGQEDFASRSLGERRLKACGRKAWVEPLYYNSNQFPNEPLRVAERTVYLPNSDVEWQFVAARSHDKLN